MGKKMDEIDIGLAVSIWWLLSAPVDFRCGADRLLVHVREALGRDPLDGSAYVFCNRRSSRMKVLVVDAQGVWLATRRLHRGRFVWPSAQETLWSLTRRQFRWLCTGVDWQRLSCDRSSLGRII
ncbi:MAG: IS66 family insertion sequence element accessory protein TnpB [Rhodanobacter sp.]